MHTLLSTTDADKIEVCPFVVAVDQREKAPWGFQEVATILSNICRDGERLVVPVKKCFLQTGDYSIIGFEGRVCCERKSLEDLYSTIGQNRDRFEAEFVRMMEMDVAAVMIEATWAGIRDPVAARGVDWRSKLNPKSVVGTVQSWTIRYPKVHWYACGSRRKAEQATFTFLERYWKEHCNELENAES